jgi:hypothetical protein
MPVVQQETYAAPHAGYKARQQQGGISPTTFYALVKGGELSAREDRPPTLPVERKLPVPTAGLG